MIKKDFQVISKCDRCHKETSILSRDRVMERDLCPQCWDICKESHNDKDEEVEVESTS